MSKSASQPARRHGEIELTMPRILIAEDDEVVRGLAARALLQNGHDVITAADGGAALEAVNREHGRFDLLLTDIKMPVMDGIALALATARDHPGITILLMTGYADQRERAHGLGALIHDVITKPLSVAAIRAAVDEALATRR
jgi:two-component system, cell cycle response regulator CpdR